MKRWFRLIGAACFMVAVSLLLWVCGYDGRLQFNKGLVSLCCFGVASVSYTHLTLPTTDVV